MTELHLTLLKHTNIDFLSNCFLKVESQYFEVMIPKVVNLFCSCIKINFVSFFILITRLSLVFIKEEGK